MVLWGEVSLLSLELDSLGELLDFRDDFIVVKQGLSVPNLLWCAGCKRHCPSSWGKLGLCGVISTRGRATEGEQVMEELLDVCGGWGSPS